MNLHKEGRSILIVSGLLFLVLGWASVYYFPETKVISYFVISVLALIYIWFLWFFRVPNITINKNDKAILAPADGKVVVIEKTTENEFLKEDRVQISVFMSPLNVHQNRAPISGKITYFKYHPGKFLVAWHPKSSTDNERTTIVMENNGLSILFRQIAGIMARRIKWYVKEGDELEQGEEFGFIRFGSRVDTYIPLDAEVKVKIGEHVKGGQTVLAVLP